MPEKEIADFIAEVEAVLTQQGFQFEGGGPGFSDENLKVVISTVRAIEKDLPNITPEAMAKEVSEAIRGIRDAEFGKQGGFRGGGTITGGSLPAPPVSPAPLVPPIAPPAQTQFPQPKLSVPQLDLTPATVRGRKVFQ